MYHCSAGVAANPSPVMKTDPGPNAPSDTSEGAARAIQAVQHTPTALAHASSMRAPQLSGFIPFPPEPHREPEGGRAFSGHAPRDAPDRRASPIDNS